MIEDSRSPREVLTTIASCRRRLPPKRPSESNLKDEHCMMAEAGRRLKDVVYQVDREVVPDPGKLA
jgi:hypothetical protein